MIKRKIKFCASNEKGFEETIVPLEMKDYITVFTPPPFRTDAGLIDVSVKLDSEGRLLSLQVRKSDRQHGS